MGLKAATLGIALLTAGCADDAPPCSRTGTLLSQARLDLTSSEFHHSPCDIAVGKFADVKKSNALCGDPAVSERVKAFEALLKETGCLEK